MQIFVFTCNRGYLLYFRGRLLKSFPLSGTEILLQSLLPLSPNLDPNGWGVGAALYRPMPSKSSVS